MVSSLDAAAEEVEAELPMQHRLTMLTSLCVVYTHLLGCAYCSQSSPYSVCEVLVCIKHQGSNMGVQVFDYIVNAVKRTGPSMEMVDDEDMATREDFSSWEWLVLNICEVCLASFAGLVDIALLQQLVLLLQPSIGGLLYCRSST